MSIDIISPSGFCKGVESALKKLEHLLEKKKFKHYYSYGHIVHNSNVMARLKEKGLIVLNPCLEELENITIDDCLIFTAHGHDVMIEEILKAKGIQYYDLICPIVEKNKLEILKGLRDIIYVGLKDHPETKGMLSLSKNIVFYDCLSGFSSTPALHAPLIVCQTTISKIDLDKYIKDIKNVYKDASLFKSICNVSCIRQEAMINIDPKYEAIIIVGDEASSNTDKLYKIGLSKCPNTFKVLDLEALKKIDLDFNKFNNIAIMSGASTSLKDVIDIKEYLDGKRI